MGSSASFGEQWHGLELWTWKTEAVVSLRGKGAKALWLSMRRDGGIRSALAVLRVVPTYKHLGSLVSSSGLPTADAFRRVQKVVLAYPKLSGHFLSSQHLEVRTKLQTAAALVDATLLHGGQLWLELPAFLASKLEGIHMRWIRKATASFRVNQDDRASDHDLRVTYLMSSVWSLLRCQRLRYLATFQKSQPVSACLDAKCRC